MARVLPNCTDRMFDVGLLNFTQPSFWKYILTAVRQLLRLSLCFCPCEYSLHVCVNSPWNAPGTRGCFAFQCSSDFEQFEQKIRAVDGGTHGWTAPGSLGEPPPGLTGSLQPNLQALLHHTPSVAVCFGRWTDGAAIRSTSTSFGRCWAEVSGRMKLEPCPCRCLIPSQSLVRTSLHCAALEPCCDRKSDVADQASIGSFVEALPSSHSRDDFGQSLGAKKQTEADKGTYELRNNVGLRRVGHDGGLVDWAKYTLVCRGKPKNRKGDVIHECRNRPAE